MGYFSNGTEGEMYVEAYCEKCLNSDENAAPGCAVWDAHLMFNYHEATNAGILDILIPRSEDKLYNEQCLMFRLDPHWNQVKIFEEVKP